jgi:site-specific DNA-cytosine methylase
MSQSPGTFASFFSGIEGFRLGLEASGWKCAYSVEIDPFCGEVQAARFGHPPQALDITTLTGDEIPDCDLFVAGWPCQGLSAAGLRKGLADERSGLFWEFVRLLERKRPAGFLAENVPGLLTTCSCPRCGFQCKDCGVLAGADDESCQECGSENLGGRVLPEHRGTDLFVVLSALQSLGYGVATRILDAQHFGVPQRRRRIFFVGRLGAPCPPEILFEPEGGGGHPEEGREEGKIAAGQLARSLGAVGGGNDYGANKGTLACFQNTGQGWWSEGDVGATVRTPKGGGSKESNLVRPKDVASSVLASQGHHGHSSPRGDGSDNLVASTLRSNAKADQGQKGENLVAGALQSGSEEKARTEVDHLVAPTVTSRQHKGGFTDPSNDGLVAVPPFTFSERSRDGVKGVEVARDGVVPALMNPGEGGRSDAVRVAIPPVAFHSTGGSRGLAAGEKSPPIKVGSGLGFPSGPAIAYPDASKKETEAFQSRYYTRGGKAGGKPGKTVDITNTHKAGDSAPLVQQPLFIDSYAVRGSGSPNQSPVKKDGKSDALNCTGPGAVAFNDHNKPKDKTGTLVGGHNGGGRNDINSPIVFTGAPQEAPPDQSIANTLGGRMRGQDDACAGNVQAVSPMSVRRLTPTECERLQGFPDGFTCLCGVRPDCPDRRIPPWLDPSTFTLGGCGHSLCGCTCSDTGRYKALGNAVATPVVEWIGARMARAEMKRGGKETP